MKAKKTHHQVYGALRECIRLILREGIEFREVESPLKYSSYGVKRLALCDSGVVEPPSKHDYYFAEIQKWERYGSSGRRLKKPRKGEIIPGVSNVCIAGFLDYHKPSENYWYIDYMKTRTDMRGKGYASQLIDEFFSRYVKPGDTVSFGKMMKPEVGHLKDKMADKYPDIDVTGNMWY